MIGILEYEADGFFLAVASDAEVEPILGRSVEIDVCVAFDFDGEGSGGGEGGGCNVAAWEAAVDEDGVGQVEVRAVGMPHRLLVVVIGLCTHRL